MNSEQEGAPLDWDGKLIEMKGPNLPLSRCPHCGVAKPFLDGSHTLTTGGGQSERIWRMFVCFVCSGVVLAVCFKNAPLIHDIYPSLRVFDASIPDCAREYLKQAQESVAQPVGSIMLCASAIDAMLKAKGIREGNLYPRVKKAAKEHLITDGMATWAHQVRLNANDQRPTASGRGRRLART